MAKEQCSTCKFWDWSHGIWRSSFPSESLAHFSYPCKRHAPSRASTGSLCGDTSIFPCTIETDWCGDYEKGVYRICGQDESSEIMEEYNKRVRELERSET